MELFVTIFDLGRWHGNAPKKEQRNKFPPSPPPQKEKN
jgi:hypothetical protein